jgi:hypothetical protein
MSKEPVTDQTAVNLLASERGSKISREEACQGWDEPARRGETSYLHITRGKKRQEKICGDIVDSH